MSIKVHFYTFSKKTNSTEQPTGDGTVFDCTFLDGADILSPTIKLNTTMTATITANNYCYIPEFSRYYYVQRWFHRDGLWHCLLSVDVMASWKSAIGLHTGYVLRSASESNGAIKDTFYPALTGPLHNSKAISLSTGGVTWTDSLASGTYVVGIISGQGTGSVNYYAMSPSEFTTFCNAIYNNSGDWMNSALITDVTTELLKTLFNPFEYIVSVMWFPVTVPTGGALGAIPLGWWSVPASGALLISDIVPLIQYTVTPDAHPQAATRGSYLNSSPYTTLTLDFQPFGLIPLDASIVCNHSLTVNLFIDYISGTACMHIAVNGDNSSTTIIYSSAAQIGVPIQVSGRQPSIGSMIAGAAGVLIDSASAVSGVLGDIAHVSSSMMGGQDLASTASGIVSQIADGLKRMSSTGSNGGRAQLLDEFYLSEDYLLIADEDNAQFGRPLYGVRQVGNLSGYIQMGDSDIAFPGLAEEIDAVRAAMIKGFFYE